MAARFRIRTSQGQEISFASHAMFAEFVRSGELSPSDVVYDAETREWSSALTHPVVLQIQYEAEGAEGGGGGDTPAADTVEPEKPSEPSEEAGIGLDLAPAPEARSPEEEAAAFVKKMEAERVRERDFDDEPAIEGLKMEQGSSGLVGGAADAPEERLQERREPPRKELRQEQPRREEARHEASADSEPPTHKKGKKGKKGKKKATKAKKVARARPPKRKKKTGTGRRYAPLLIVGAVVVAAGVYFGPELMAPATGEGSEAGPDSVASPPPPPLIPDTEESLRGRAQESFLTTTRALLRDLPRVPDTWLEGAYLATPSDYPQVRDAWNEILATVRQIRAGDNERYRAGYLRAMDDARVAGGSARTLRLANAVADFQGEVAPRAEHWDRVETLALAALRGHDTLVEAEGTIAYEPAATTPVSGDPVIEAVGRNAQAQALLEQVLDMILAELNAPRGPGNTANLGEWIWDGLLGAVTS